MNRNLLIIAGVILLLIISLTVVNNYKSPSPSSPESQISTPAISQSENESTKSASSNIPCSGKPLVPLTEGPYYTSNTPEKKDLTEPGTSGEKLVLTGYVLDTGCQPIKGAWIDFWQTDGGGNYDNSGYKFRGHQFSDANGRYSLTTVVPDEYPGRTPHIHFKIRASDSSPIITSQLFIPGVAGNETDTIYDESLLISNVQQTAEGKTANFNFVIEN